MQLINIYFSFDILIIAINKCIYIQYSNTHFSKLKIINIIHYYSMYIYI